MLVPPPEPLAPQRAIEPETEIVRNPQAAAGRLESVGGTDWTKRARALRDSLHDPRRSPRGRKVREYVMAVRKKKKSARKQQSASRSKPSSRKKAAKKAPARRKKAVVRKKKAAKKVPARRKKAVVRKKKAAKKAPARKKATRGKKSAARKPAKPRARGTSKRSRPPSGSDLVYSDIRGMLHSSILKRLL
jgi:hypothetical protein